MNRYKSVAARGKRNEFIVVMIIVCLITLLVAIHSFANFVVYVIHWEQNETEWCEVSTYGQEHSVYVTMECSFDEHPRTFRLPSDVAGAFAIQVVQAAKDSNAHGHEPEPSFEVE